MRLLVSCLFWFVFAFAIGAGEPAPIAVAAGEEFEVVLDSPGGKDLHWLLSKPLDESRIKQLGSGYRRYRTASGTPRTAEVLRYQAVAKGRTEVHLKLMSFFKTDSEAAPRTNFVVVVGDPRPRVIPAKK